MNAPPCSWRTGTNWIEDDPSSASFRSSVSSPGMPKTWRTPSFSRQRTNTSAAVVMAAAQSIGVWRRPVAPATGLPEVPAGIGVRPGDDPLLGIELGRQREVVVDAAPAGDRVVREAVPRLHGGGLVVARGRPLPVHHRHDAGAVDRRPVALRDTAARAAEPLGPQHVAEAAVADAVH